MQSKLDHTTLQKIGQHLGYPLDDQGICHGFSCMLMQAILAEEEARFWERLHLIARYQSNFSLLATEIEAVKGKVKEHSAPLTKQDNELLEILAFYEGIELYLNAHLHHDVFNKSTQQNNVDEIYHLTKSTKLKDNSLSIVLNQFSAHGNKKSLIDYLEALEKVIQQHTNLPLLITSSNHSVLVKYNPQTPKNPWMYVDTNDFARYYSNPNYYRELNTRELVNALFNSLGPYPNPVLFNIKLVTNSGHPINTDQSLQQFQTLYKIESKHTKMYDQFDAGLLYIACLMGHTKIVRMLLEYNEIETNKATLNGVTPLFSACLMGHTKIVHLLLARDGIEINKTTQDGATPLYIACQNGHTEIVRMLLACDGAGINKTKLTGSTPLYIACQNGRTEIVHMLLAHDGVMINKAIPDGTTPLYIACQMGHTKIVRILLACDGAGINKTKLNGCTPLYIACQMGHIPCATLLLQTNKATIDSVGLQQHTPLLVACLSPHTQEKNELFRLLLQYAANPLHKNDKGQTAYDIAFSQTNHAAITELLLHAKENQLPLDSKTMNKARNWLDNISKSYGTHFFNSTLLLPPGLKRYIYDSTTPSDSNNLENKK